MVSIEEGFLGPFPTLHQVGPSVPLGSLQPRIVHVNARLRQERDPL